MGDTSFRFWVPATAALVKGNAGEREMRIRGVVSTDQPDINGERVIQDGLQWNYFKKHGFFRWQHTPKPGEGPDTPQYATVGKPLSVRKKKAGKVNSTEVEGVLFETEVGKQIFDTQVAMQKAGGRSYGFSVEGRILKREDADKRIIAKAHVRNIAIDPHPVNPAAQMEAFVKALGPYCLGCGECSDDPDLRDACLAEGMLLKAEDFEEPEEPEEDDDDEEPKVEGEEDLDLEEALDTAAIAPLTKESLAGKQTELKPAPKSGRRKRKKRRKKEMSKALEAWGALSDEERAEVLAKHGGSPGEPTEQDDLRKALDHAEAVIGQASDAIGTRTVELPDAIKDVRGGMDALGSGISDVRETQDASAEAIIGIGELVKAQTSAMLDMRDKIGDLEKKLADYETGLEGLNKAMRQPVEGMQRGVTSGSAEALQAPGEQSNQENHEFLTKAQASGPLMDALHKAQRTGDMDLARGIAHAVQHLDAMPNGMIRRDHYDRLVGKEG